MTGDRRDILTLNTRLSMETTNEPVAPISSKAAACLSSFDYCITIAASIDAQRQSSLEDQIARFSIWTSNMAAFAKSKLSLDHRLRWAPKVRDWLLLSRGVILQVSRHWRCYGGATSLSCAASCTERAEGDSIPKASGLQ